MLVRIIQFIIGAALAAGGGYLAWTHRSGGMNIFPPADGMPWLVIAGVLGLSAGIVFLVSAVHPRPQRRARLAAQAAERDAALGAAETYYSERGRAADRDWRAGDIPAPATPVAVAPEPAPAAPMVEPVRATPAPAPVSPPPPAPAPAKPVATSAPPAAAAPETFPSTATLAPIPAAAEPPPAPAKPQAATPAAAAPPAAAPVTQVPAAPVAAAPAGPIAEIRAALAAGQFDDVDRMLNARRETARGLELAELTGLAGDHAAALGRTSNAKWLWRLSLKRFGELNAIDTPAAVAVAERLRTTD